MGEKERKGERVGRASDTSKSEREGRASDGRWERKNKERVTQGERKSEGRTSDIRWEREGIESDRVWARDRERMKSE